MLSLLVSTLENEQTILAFYMMDHYTCSVATTAGLVSVICTNAA
jgi:hypothetical protein